MLYFVTYFTMACSFRATLRLDMLYFVTYFTMACSFRASFLFPTMWITTHPSGFPDQLSMHQAVLGLLHPARGKSTPTVCYQGYHTATKATTLLSRLPHCYQGYHTATKATTLLPTLSLCGRDYHFATMVMILISWLSLSCHGYHFFAKAITFLPRLFPTKATCM